jgi:putative ABC transport system permease protein
MTSRALAWRTLTAERPRAVLAVTGVVVIGALLFDMLLLSQGLLLSLRQMLDSAGYDVRVVSSDGFPVRSAMPAASSIAGELATLPEVGELTVVRTDRAVVLANPHAPVETALLNVTPGTEERVWRSVAGASLGAVRETSAPPPAVIDRGLGEILGLAPGSMIHVRVVVSGAASALPVQEFEVVGTAEFPNTSTDEHVVATTLDAFQRARASTASDVADLILVSSRPGIESSATAVAIERRRSDVTAYSNEQVVKRFDENGFSYFRQISFVLSSITLAFAFLLVATLLTVSVNQRLGEVAALRALGLPRRRIAAMLAWESVFLVGVGGVCSLPVGWLLAMRLDRILRQMPNIPDRMHFFVFEPRLAAWHLGLLAVTAVAAVAYPVWIAARLPIAATLRTETIS